MSKFLLHRRLHGWSCYVLTFIHAMTFATNHFPNHLITLLTDCLAWPSLEIFKELAEDSMSQLKEESPSASTRDRRAWVRYPSNQTTLCQEKTAQTYDLWFIARILDISQTDIRLLLGHAFELGVELAVEPIRAAKPFGRALQARAVD